MSAAEESLEPIVVRPYGAGSRTVVALHGGPGAEGCPALAQALAADFRVLEPVQRRSGRVPLTVEQHVQDLAEVAPRPAVLVGTSWGAMLALSYASRRPADVEALVLVGCGTYDEPSRALYRAALERRLGDAPRRPRSLAEMAAQHMRASSYELDDDATEPFGVDEAGHHETWQDALRLQREGIEPAAFRAITARTLMVHGDVDPHPGPATRDLLRRFVPQLEYVELERCGHEPWRERYARAPFLATLRSWLALMATVFIFAGTASAAEPLRVGTSGDYAPFSNDGKGFEIDAAKLVGEELGREVVFVPFQWPELAGRVAAGDFDVAMSGVTWRPERAVVGRMSLGFAAGGPCWLGAPTPKSVGVNAGGVLEKFARLRFPNARLKVVEDNRSLPQRFARGEIEAIVTDSFEVVDWQRRVRAPSHCEPPRDLKVWWVAPEQADALGPKLDAFVRAREPDLAKLRERWFGQPQERGPADHVVDLVARRLAFMPAVGAWKRDHARPVEDLAQEAAVLDAAEEGARAQRLDPASVRALFALQIELAKRIQSRAPAAASGLDLAAQMRPALAEISTRQLEALGLAAPLDPEALEGAALEPLGAFLEPAEVRELASALGRVKRAE